MKFVALNQFQIHPKYCSRIYGDRNQKINWVRTRNSSAKMKEEL